jgi:hypothetical protein
VHKVSVEEQVKSQQIFEALGALQRCSAASVESSCLVLCRKGVLYMIHGTLPSAVSHRIHCQMIQNCRVQPFHLDERHVSLVNLCLQMHSVQHGCEHRCALTDR